jgi:hypothetical protein
MILPSPTYCKKQEQRIRKSTTKKLYAHFILPLLRQYKAFSFWSLPQLNGMLGQKDFEHWPRQPLA